MLSSTSATAASATRTALNNSNSSNSSDTDTTAYTVIDPSPSSIGDHDDDVEKEVTPFPWRRVLLIALVGFLTDCKPSEPFLSKYLLEDKQIPEHVIETSVWPVYTFASLAFVLPVGLLADSWGHRQVIALGLVARQITRAVLVLGAGLMWMQVMQMSFALAGATTQTAYLAYAFTVVGEEQHFMRTASVLMASTHLGNVVGSLLGQMLVNSGVALTDLFALSWIISTVGAMCFPFAFPNRRTTSRSIRGSSYKPNEHDTGTDFTGQQGESQQQQHHQQQQHDPHHHQSLSIVSLARDAGSWRAVVSALISLYGSGGVVLWAWSAWTVLSSIGVLLWGNYYQLFLLGFDRSLSGFGYVEVFNELALCTGSAAAAWFASAGGGMHVLMWIRRCVRIACAGLGMIRQVSTSVQPNESQQQQQQQQQQQPVGARRRVLGSSGGGGVVGLAGGTALWIATILPRTPGALVWAALLANVYLFIFAAQSSYASARIATCLRDNPRYPVVFAVNGFVSLVLCSVVQSVAMAANASSDEYMALAAIFSILAGLTLMLPSMLLRYGWCGGGGMEGEDGSGCVHVVVELSDSGGGGDDGGHVLSDDYDSVIDNNSIGDGGGVGDSDGTTAFASDAEMLLTPLNAQK